MTEFAANQLEKLLRKRCDYEAKGLRDIIPPQLHLHAIATHCQIPIEEVMQRIEAMRKPKDQPA